jgi:phosphoribosylanthranilate isomerase
MVRIKICGITTLEDALIAAEAGADMLGFNFYPPSPRSIRVQEAQSIAHTLRAELAEACPLLAGIFVDESCHVVATAGMLIGLDFAQLCGRESQETIARLEGLVVKAIRPRDRTDAILDVSCYVPYAPQDDRVPSLIVDAFHPSLYGGTGEQTSLDVALAVKDCVPRMMLAGGLTPDNVAERVGLIQPWGVDVASGVEDGAPGRKDADKVRRFIEAVREVTA